jgi:anti-sigma factor (TIGR02949 family)
MEMLQAILDGDASDEQKQQFKDHMEGCMPCYKQYSLEIVIKELLKTKCCGNGAPPELADRIKNHISSNPKA